MIYGKYSLYCYVWMWLVATLKASYSFITFNSKQSKPNESVFVNVEFYKECTGSGLR